MKHIAILGGAFDPPHLGHSMIVSIALSKLNCGDLWILPCYESAFGKKMNTFEHRYEMCKKAFNIFDSGVVYVSKLEEVFKAKSSLEFIKKLKEKIAGEDTKITFIVGEDNWKKRHLWDNWEELESLVEFFVVGRGGEDEFSIKLPDISSTKIRGMIKDLDMRYKNFVSNDVVWYIENNKLYEKEK